MRFVRNYINHLFCFLNYTCTKENLDMYIRILSVVRVLSV